MCVCCWVVMEDDVSLDTGHELFRLYVVCFEEKGFDVSASCCGHFSVGELVCVPKEKQPVECVKVWCDVDDCVYGVFEWPTQFLEKSFISGQSADWYHPDATCETGT